jgi:hypothetical protein
MGPEPTKAASPKAVAIAKAYVTLLVVVPNLVFIVIGIRICPHTI